MLAIRTNKEGKPQVVEIYPDGKDFHRVGPSRWKEICAETIGHGHTAYGDLVIVTPSHLFKFSE